MAEFVLKDLAKKAGREREFSIASCATSTEEIWGDIGNPVYPPVKALLSRLGIVCEGKRAVLLTRADGEKYDLFLGMDDNNLRRMKGILGEKYADKCHKLLEYTGIGGNVADPWYTRDFETTYRYVYAACQALLAKI